MFQKHETAASRLLRTVVIAGFAGLGPLALGTAPTLAQGHGGMPMPQAGSAQSAGEKATGIGTVNAVKAGERKVNLSHEPIPAIKWPSMTMDFATAPSVDLSQVKPGTKVQFTLTRAANGSYTVESIKPMP